MKRVKANNLSLHESSKQGSFVLLLKWWGV